MQIDALCPINLGDFNVKSASKTMITPSTHSSAAKRKQPRLKLDLATISAAEDWRRFGIKDFLDRQVTDDVTRRMIVKWMKAGVLNPLGSVVPPLWDTVVLGLKLRVGRRVTTWTFHREHCAKGKRTVTSITLGHYPSMTITEARQAARQAAAAAPAPGKRTAVKFEAAFEDYCKYLETLAAQRGKPARWLYNVKQMGAKHLKPRWAGWSLIDLSNDPRAVAAWHSEVTESSGAVCANHCAMILRACYKRAGRLDRSVPFELPTSGVTYNPKASTQPGLAFKDFPKWAEAWARLPPLHRAFHLVQFLTGGRPGEISRLRWADIHPKQRTLTITNPKAGHDIVVPLSIPIVQALRLARDCEHIGIDGRRLDRGDGDMVFPGAGRWQHKDALPARGMDLRRTWKTVAISCGVEEILTEFLQGHAPVGVSRKYVVRAILRERGALREGQRRISMRITSLLGSALHNGSNGVQMR